MKRGFRWCIAFLSCSLLLSTAVRAEEPGLKFASLLAQRVSEVRSSLQFPNMPKLWRPDAPEGTSGVIVVVTSVNPHPGLWMELTRQDFELTYQRQGESQCELQGLCFVVPDPPALRTDGPWYLGFSRVYVMSTDTKISFQLLFEVPLDVTAVSLTFRGQTVVESLPISETAGE